MKAIQQFTALGAVLAAAVLRDVPANGAEANDRTASVHPSAAAPVLVGQTGLAPAREPSVDDSLAHSPARVTLRGAGARAFQYFARTGREELDARIRSLRREAGSAASRRRSLAQVRSADLVLPSSVRAARLAALRPTLAYFDRESTDVRIVRLGLAWVTCLDGPVILLSEAAVDLLSTDELQAVVAHELAHEYFAAEYEAARELQRNDMLHEVELRCDAMAIVALTRLGRDPHALLSALDAITRWNERLNFSNSEQSPTVAERHRFWSAMVQFVEGSGGDVQRRATYGN